jgi:HK97 family phage major capsid protein
MSTAVQTVESKVQAALDKQAGLFSEFRDSTGSDISTLKTALETMQAKLDSLTSDDAPRTVEEKASGTAMIDDQVAGQLRSIKEETQRAIDELETRFNLAAGQPANDVIPDMGEELAALMLTDDNVRRTADAINLKSPGWAVKLDKDIPSIVSLPRLPAGMLRDVIGLDEAGALDPRFRRSEVVRHLREPTNVASLFRQVSIRNQRYEFARQTFVGLHASINTTVNGAHGDSVTVIAVTDGSIFIEDSVVEFHTSAGPIAKFVSISTNDLTISDTAGGTPSALGVALAGGEQVTSETYKATAEEAAKPEGFDEYEEIVQFLIMLATHITTTEQRLHFAPLFQAFLNGELRERHLRNVDHHVLYGTGDGTVTQTELPGLANETGVQTLAWSVGQTKDTQADLVLRGADLIFSDDNASLTAIMNRTQWRNVVTLKGTDGHYVSNRGPVMISDEPGRRFIGPISVRRSGKCRVSDIFVVDPSAAAELVSGGNARIAMGHNNDDFRKNKLAIRYEESLLFAILSTTGYIVLDVDSQPA